MNKHLINHRPTEELVQLNADHHIQPFADGAITKGKGSRIISRAEGVYLYDNDGAQILDAMAGLWCVNIGYGRPELAEVAARQMRELPYYNTFFQTAHPPVVELAAKLAEITPGNLSHVFFGNSGSDANDTNLRFVRHYWAAMGKPSKQAVISRLNAYHGSSIAGTSLGGMLNMHAQGGVMPGIHWIDEPNWWVNGGDESPEEFGLRMARQLEEKIRELGEANVAAFIAEPIQGAGGVIVPPDTYWPEIQRICDAYEILLIADEVITGFGRTGNWFATETYDLRPDIITVAKGLSSGYVPISGSIIREDIAAAFAEKAGPFFHGYTYSGHPVAAAVALENIRILEEENIVRTCAAEVVPYFEERWATLIDHELVGETRQKGMLGAIQLTPNARAKAPFDMPGRAGLIVKECGIENGVMCRNVKDSIAVSPPLIVTRAHVDELLTKVTKSLDDAMPTLKAEGLLG
ncbi:MAG: aspartate aminotransferase family protein [Pseudomonadota bacterium]